MQTEQTELGYWAVPDGGGPGIVVVHDVWGLYDHYRDLARRLAGEGFVTLAVDLYRPLGDVKVEDPGPWMRDLSDPEVLARIGTAVEAVHAHPKLAGEVGVTGFCMGGTYTLLAAASVPGIAAAAPFYGILSFGHGLYAGELDPAKKPRDVLTATKDIACPVLAAFGAEDALIPLEHVREFERRLAGVPHPSRVFVYDGAGHAFVNDTRPQMYRPEAAKLAWGRMVEFFRERLREGAPP